VRQFLFSLEEEYFALVAAEPGVAPDKIHFAFYDEGIQSPLLPIDWRDLDVWVVGDFHPVEEAFPDVTLTDCIREWELTSGEKWDDSNLVLRAIKIRVEVVVSQEYESDFSPKEIGESLVVDYSFGAVEQLKLHSRVRCYAGSIEELESCAEQNQ